jgi:tetratricopeptide (TPR) repeat protein
VFLISGEPGIGKTRLADELGAEAASRGMRVVWGRCWEGGGAPAYLPWVDVLRSLIIHEPRERERHSALPAEIAQLIPELSSEATMPRVSADPAQARFRLFDAVATVLKQLARAEPLLVIIDDLHEADHSSLELLKFVARGLTDSRIVIVGTHRDAEVRRSPYLSESIGEILRYGRAIPLAGLDQNEVTQLVEHRAQRLPSAAFASELYRVTAGNPLFVDGITRVLLAERKLGTSDRIDLRGFKVPEDVRGAIRKRLGLLSTQAQSVLAVAAVLGQEFDTGLLRRISNLSAGTFCELMDEASEVGVVAPSSHDSYRFTHPLIREALYKGSTEAERMRLHRVIGEALEQMHAANLTPHLAALAHHFREACIVEKAIDYSIRAGEAAYAVYAYAEALAQWEAALEVAERHGVEPARRADLLFRLGDELLSTGSKLVDYLEAAAPIYESLGNHDRAVETHSRLGLYFSGPSLGARDVRRAMEHFRKAEALSSSRLDLNSAVHCIRKALACLWAGRIDEGMEAVRRAIDISEQTENETARVWGVSLLSRLLVRRGALAEAVELSNLARRISNPVNDTMLGSTVAWVGGENFLMLGDPREAQAWFTWGLSIPRTARSVPRREILHQMMVLACGEAGDLIKAREHLGQVGGHTSLEAADGVGAGSAAVLTIMEGDWESADKQLTESFECANATGNRVGERNHACGRARLYRIRGEFVRARECAEYGLSIGIEAGDLYYELRVRAELALILEASDRSREAIPHLERCREIMAGGEDWRGLAGEVARAEAVVAAAEGRLIDAETCFERALSIFQRYTLPWEEAESLLLWGRALGPTDEPRANEKFDATIEIYRRHGAGQCWVDRVETDRNTGVSRSGVTSDDGTFPPIFRKEGEYWKTAYEGGSANVRERGGMRFIAMLLGRPGENIPAVEMFAAIAAGDVAGLGQDGLTPAGDLGDAGEKFDARALSEYRRRLTEVESEIEAAEASHDSGALARARAEGEMLSQEIASGTGLYGGLRRAASHHERARVNVTRQIKSAIDAIQKVNLPLGRHLANSIYTGSSCRYAPADRIKWQL